DDRASRSLPVPWPIPPMQPSSCQGITQDLSLSRFNVSYLDDDKIGVAMSDIADPPPSRRRILGSTTLGATAGLLTGLAAGIAFALPPKAAPVPPQPG